MKKVKSEKPMDSKTLAENICKIIIDRKGEDVVAIDIKSKSSVADYYVIASGRSMSHTRSLIEHVEEETEKLGFVPIREEGVREGRWAVIDYGDVIVHVFNDETRLMYHIEKLWGEEDNITKFS